MVKNILRILTNGSAIAQILRCSSSLLFGHIVQHCWLQTKYVLNEGSVVFYS